MTHTSCRRNALPDNYGVDTESASGSAVVPSAATTGDKTATGAVFMASIFGDFQCPGNSAEKPGHQFVFCLHPVVQVMPRLSARLNENLMGSAADLFLGGAMELHTTFVLLLSCWVLKKTARPAWFPLLGLLSQLFEIRVIAETFEIAFC